MVEYPIGELIAGQVRAMGVTPFYKMFEHDGVRGPNMAAVYSDRGFGVRGPVVFYNRSNEAAAQLKPGDFDWKAIFGAGVRWFHSGGIFASLSETTADLIIEAMQAAKAHGAVVSFDLNYREKLWRAAGGADRAVAVLGRIVEHVDVLVGNEEDLQKGLGIAGPQVAAKSKLDPSAFVDMMARVVARFPNMKIVATTLREVHSTSRHGWGAVAWIDGQTVRVADVRAGRLRSRRRRRRLRVGVLLRAAERRVARRSRPPRLGARRAADDVPRRHDDGEPGAGARVRPGRLGANRALVNLQVSPSRCQTPPLGASQANKKRTCYARWPWASGCAPSASRARRASLTA